MIIVKPEENIYKIIFPHDEGVADLTTRALRFCLVILSWCLFIPLSLSAESAHYEKSRC